jgi:predicted nuclease with TOPRIM domain
MAKHLTSKDIEIFIQILDAWEGKLTWEALCEAGAQLIGSRPTRQTLNAHEEIKKAYKNRKSHLGLNHVPSRRPASLSIAEQRIRRLEGENSRLREENDRLLEQFIRWQYNTYKHGLTKEKLDAPLPLIDRDSSEKPQLNRPQKMQR